MFGVLLAACLLASPPSYALGETDMTPGEPLMLGGFTDRKGAKGVLGSERLKLRTVYLVQGPTKVVFASMECLTIPESFYAAVKEKLPPDVHLFLAATHTHSAPDSQMLNSRMNFSIPGIATYSKRWLDWYSQNVADGILKTISSQSFSIGKLTLSQGVADANHLRRKLNGPPDKRVSVFVADRRPLIGIYAAHATIFDEKSNVMSGDWPGRWMAKGPWAAFPGAIGDVSPELRGSGYEAQAGDLVDRLEKARKIAPAVLENSAVNPLVWLETPIILDKPVPHPDFAKSSKIPDALAETLVNKFAPTAATLQLASIGDFVLVGVPGEPTADLGRRIQAAGYKLGLKQIVVTSHTNGWMGYILEPKDYQRGGYEATLAFHGANAADRVVEAAEKLFQNLSTLRSGRGQSLVLRSNITD